MLTTQQFKSYIDDFILLQKMLLETFKEHFPLLRDWENLFDFPRKGEISTPKGVWKFRLHGCGLCFSGPKNELIDAHDMVSCFDVIDAWRLLQFLESVHAVNENEVGVSDMKRILEQLSIDNFLAEVGGHSGKYRLSR